jgi:putative transposase
MPWREMSPMDQRTQFVLDYRSGLFTMTELARQYGISRKTGYKWAARYDEVHGTVDVQERSRRPHHSPEATDPAVVARLIALRKRYPLWGPKKLLAVGARTDPHLVWPCRSTACEVLKRAGLVLARARSPRLPHPSSALAPITHANGTWTTDFKGEFRTGDHRYCYPLTLRDGHSRFVLHCGALVVARTFAETQRRFARAFAQYGLPDRLRSDNGLPFAGPGLGRLSRLSVWWMRLGIVPERITPGHPEENGAHEQFHAVLKTATARPPAPNARAQQRRFDRFVPQYNYDRPHEALGDRPPATYYVPSARPLPAVLPPLDYPGHWDVRRVSSNGCISWNDAPLFLTESLAGELVGFEEVEDGVWTVSFATVALARFDARQHRLHPLARIGEGALADSVGSRLNDKQKPKTITIKPQ